MIKYFVTLSIFLLIKSDLIAQIATYNFTGTGDWNNIKNWKNNNKPPSRIIRSSLLIINPVGDSECVLDSSLVLLNGSKLLVEPGKKLSVEGDIIINPDEVIVYTNATDTRLAQIIAANNKTVTFFGERFEDGSPKRLTAYSITSNSDSSKFDFVTLDEEGRYNSIILSTGESLHLKYDEGDSVILTLSSADSVSRPIYARTSSPNFFNQFMSFSNKNQKNPGYDKKVNVKVRKFNETTGVIEEVNGSDATVLINFKSLKFDYDIFALYDKDLMIYSVPLSSSGLIYTDELARYNILRLIKNTLELACTKTKSGDVNLDKAILGLIATYVCPVPTPVSAAVCAAAGAGIIICTANEVLSILEKAFEQSKNPYINQFKDLLPTNDPSFVPLEDASVTVTSKHYKFGYKSTTPILASKIPENPNLIDFEITYTYRVPSVTTSTVTNIEQTSAKVSGNVVDEGGSFVYDRGVCLGTKPSPSIKQKVSSGSGSGVFTIDLTGLVAGAKYYVRSYASNKIETSYGNEVSFIAKVPEGWCRVEVLWKQPFGSPSFNSSCTNCQVIKFIGDIFGTISWCYEREPVGGQIGQAYLMKSGSSMTFYQTDYICPGPTVTLGPYKCQ